MRILLVDDDRASLRLLERNLLRWDYDVVCANDGLEAMEYLEAHPDLCLLITDWSMPRMNGLELCRRARKLEREIYLHIIMLTNRENKADLIRSLEAGADAFLSKPLDPPELQVHIKVACRMIDLAHRLEHKIHELDGAHKALQHEIEAAGRIQRSLLPTVAPVVPYIDTAWLFQSCNATAGDMLNVVRLDEDHLGIYVLDVSGHGCQAAMLSVSLSRVLNPYPQQGGILKEFTQTGKRYRIPTPAEVALELNRRFPVMRQSGQFFTFLYGIINIKTLDIQYTRAGHPEPLHYSNGAIQHHNDRSAVPVGIIDEPEYDNYHAHLAPGDLLLFFTDGFEEAKDAEGNEFGRDNLETLLATQPGWRANQAVDAVKQALAEFTKDTPQTDDMTMVAVSIHPDRAPGEIQIVRNLA